MNLTPLYTREAETALMRSFLALVLAQCPEVAWLFNNDYNSLIEQLSPTGC